MELQNEEKVKASDVVELFDDCVKIIRNTNDIESKWYVYDNQIETAKEIIFNFYTRINRWCLLFAEMQSGKSGTFFSIPYIIARNKILASKLGIDMYGSETNVYLLTGMNEKELIQQFETDISSFTGMDIKKNILHNSEMRKFLSKDRNDWSDDDVFIIEKMKKNSLILIDESHYGSDKSQVLNKFLTKVLEINPNGDNVELEKNNIYVVSISATPMAEFINANISEFKKKIVPLKNSYGYWGIIDMFNNNKIINSNDLKDDRSVDMIIDHIQKINKIGYILIRCSAKQQDRIKSRLGYKNINNIGIINYDQYERSRILDNMGINDILQNIPNKKTIIFLKGLLRAGKRVDTKNIIMVHDTSESKVDTTVQSLLGRCCGYNKNKEIDIFCDRQSALKYKTWVESDYDIKLVPDKSKNVIGKDSIGILTYSDPILFDICGDDIEKLLIKNKKTKSDKINILRLLNNKYINNILDSGKYPIDYEIGTIFNVDKNKKNTSYDKQYNYVLKYKRFMGDYKPLESEIGKIIFSAAYEIVEKKLLVSFGKVHKMEVKTTEKTMYHETNLI